MAQETLDSLIQVIFTLPTEEREYVISRLQDNINRNSQKFQPTEEQKERLRKSYLDAQAGRVYSQEDAHQILDEFAKDQYAVAV